MTSAPKLPHDDTDFGDLRSGDHMSRELFHRIYSVSPANVKAELLGGVVYVASPAKNPHGQMCSRLHNIFGAYQGHTPGTDCSENVTVTLGDEDEVQPDLLLRILPSCGGRSKDTDDEYIQGQPELVAEIAYTSMSIDFHTKRQRYQKAGVLEYIVICIRPKQLRWFDLQADLELTPDAESITRSKALPGLWIQADSLLQFDYHRAMNVLHRGMNTGEHAEFVAKLASFGT